MRHYVHIIWLTLRQITRPLMSRQPNMTTLGKEVDTMRKFYGGKNEITGVCELASYAGSVPLAFHPI